MKYYKVNQTMHYYQHKAAIQGHDNQNQGFFKLEALLLSLTVCPSLSKSAKRI
jgi:hypothetical protein